MVRIRRRFVIAVLLIVFVAAGITVCGLWYGTRPTHEVVVYLRIRSAPRLSLQDNGTFLYDVEPPLDYQKEMEAVAALIRSPLVLGAAVAKFEVAALLPDQEEDRIKSLQELIEFEVVSRELLVVKMAGRESQMRDFRAVLNEVIDCYSHFRGSPDTGFLEHTARLLEAERRRHMDEFVALRGKLTRQANDATNPAEEAALELAHKELERTEKVIDALALALVELRCNRNAPERVELLSQATIRKLEKNRTPPLFAD